MTPKPVFAVIGGSGLYQMAALKDVQTYNIDTPFGKPSAPVVVGNLEGNLVAFLARHGIGHTISPSEVNYRANIYALKSLGVERIVSISACGSLREDYKPGDIVIPDQVFDFTRGLRLRTFFGDGIVAHIGSGDPYCPNLSDAVYEAVKYTGATVHKCGALVVIEGPRFSTIGESHIFRSWGMSIIGMTASPEIFLAREAEICYSTMAHVTDYDVWHVSEEPVSVEMVIRILMKNTQTAQKSLEILAAGLPAESSCTCHEALRSAVMTDPKLFPDETYKKLSLFLDKYFKQ